MAGALIWKVVLFVNAPSTHGTAGSTVAGFEELLSLAALTQLRENLAIVRVLLVRADAAFGVIIALRVVTTGHPSASSLGLGGRSVRILDEVLHSG